MPYTHALVSTVDSIPDFPGHRVWLFQSEQQAIDFATDLLVKFYWTNDPLVLEKFQDSLSATEYFHVLRIEKT